jgi:hypothetical protein
MSLTRGPEAQPTHQHLLPKALAAVNMLLLLLSIRLLLLPPYHSWQVSPGPAPL